MTDKHEQKTELLLPQLDNLINLGRADTFYHDLYLQRAVHYLVEEYTRQDYLNFKSMQVREANLPNQIRNAMNRADWREVNELSGHYKTVQDELESKTSLQEYAEKIYRLQPTPIDPFSAGMHKIAGFSSDRLQQLLNETIRRLKELSQTDKEWKEFYSERLTVFERLTLNTADLKGPLQQVSAMDLSEEAAQALEDGDMARLEKLSERLVELPVKKATPAVTADLPDGAHPPSKDYFYDFSPETIKKGKALGLELFHVPSRSTEFAPLCRFAWHPTFAETQGNQSSVQRVKDLPLPNDLPEAMKTRIQLFARHPFINSAGVRFLPHMLAEDLLIEDFPEPAAGKEPPLSGLLEALGLTSRNHLSREEIEAVLTEKGGELLRNELGLDEKKFRLVCIPPDIHLRVGQEQGWGQQKIWTHYDGYMILADNTRQALAGGDVRFGGIYDLLGLSSSYDTDRLIARFAVVQRRRMATWQ